jgi:uncharacterized membrane protein YhaH (DUF805 family)
MSVTSTKALYYFLRAALALLGLFLVSSALFSFLSPDIAHSESQRPTWQNTLLDVAFLLYGLLLLVPYRWLRQPFLFPIALLVFALGILWAVYVGISGFVGLVQGRKSWLILPVSIIFVVLAMAAPTALMMRRRLDADMK